MPDLKEDFADNLSDAMKAEFEMIIQKHLDMTSLETGLEISRQLSKWLRVPRSCKQITDSC